MKRVHLTVAAFGLAAVVALAGCSENEARVGIDGRRGLEGFSGRQGGGTATPELSPERAAEEDLGPKVTVTGELSFDDPEWFLETDDGTVALHLGNRSYLESLDLELKEGMSATVEGFVEDDGLSVTTLSLGDGKFTFRDEGGVPLWAGRGRGQSAQAEAKEDDSSESATGGRGYGRRGGGSDGSTPLGSEAGGRGAGSGRAAPGSAGV